ncbi:hypothetical protein [Spirulina subsalsa]|uniref:hypothetical protein n=1 Tax=Spirulina subsalsa TaxID=54311 RepID=UPI0002FCE17C|nr:hypothetical protein [Spirulina subsalsa]
MSYWAWLARMALFGLLGIGGTWFMVRSIPLESATPSSSATSGDAIAINPEYFLPSGYDPSQSYQPTANTLALPTLPMSRLDSLRPPEDYEAMETTEGESPTPQNSNRPTGNTPPPPTAEQQAAYRQGGEDLESNPNFDLNNSVTRHSRLFATPISLGMLAIGVAEGNYRVFAEQGTLYVEQTPNYFGHVDPGNLSWGQRVTNFGPCSDQGRSGGDISQAEKMCLARSLERLPTNLNDLNAAGINPDQDIEALLNTADLYNQASPIHSRLFPYALAIAYRAGLQGTEAMAWARTASFYVNGNQQLDLQRGRNVASGLLGICSREGRAVTEWECVHMDQMRRTKAIRRVLDLYAQVYQSN